MSISTTPIEYKETKNREAPGAKPGHKKRRAPEGTRPMMLRSVS